MNTTKEKVAVALLAILGAAAWAQSDTRYDAALNLPFNEKAGNVNPQTGSVTVEATDLRLPGRAGLDFSFSRVWTTSTSNVYAMYRDCNTWENRLSSETVEGRTHLGTGWSANIPMIFDDLSSGEKTQYLFLEGSAYELDQGGMKVRNNQKSNILWYDLLDKRVYEDSSIGYADNPRFAEIAAAHAEVEDTAAGRSKYVLIYPDNSKWYFRSDGQAMMREDRTGLSRIWYFYDGENRLALVEDTVGRLIAFSYDGNGNLAEISWQVTSWKKDEGGNRAQVAETRRVRYGYASAGTGGSYPKAASLKGEVIGYRTPYALTSVTDPMGHETSYAYTEGVAGFTYDDARSHSSNVYLLLTCVRSMVRSDGGALSEQVFEYNNTDTSETNPKKYRKYFFTGYMEYFKVIRQAVVDRHGRALEATKYHYYDNGENGNNQCYTAVLEKGKARSEYRYSISGVKSQDDVLDLLSVSTEDGYVESHDYTYTAERTKSLETVYRGGKYAYAEKYQYDSKGRPTRVEDRLGLVTVTEYDPTYGVPVREYRTLLVGGASRTYQKEWTLTSLGQVKSETRFLQSGSGSRAVRTSLNIYDAWGNLVSVENALGEVTHTDWDAETHSLPVRIWQEVKIASWSSGGDVEDNWRANPDLESDGTAVDRIRSWKEYNSDGQVWLEADNEGYGIEHFYDELGNEIERVLPDGNDERGFAGEDLTRLTDSSSFSSFLSSRLDNAGSRMDIDYEQDLVITREDIDKSRGEEKTTGVQKDGLGHVEAEIEYDGAGGEYSRKEMAYDALGRMIAITDQDAGRETVSVTVGGTKVSRHDKTWLISYDDIGRQKTIYYPETVSGRTDRKLFTYEDAENAVTVTDADRRIVYQKKDWADNLVLVTEKGYGSGVEQSYKYEYDALKRKTRFTDPRGIVTEYAYDERDLMTEQKYGDSGGSDTMRYDDAGRLVRKTDRKGQVLVMEWDELGRNTAVKHYTSAAAETSGTPVRTVKTVYDRRGNAVRVSSEKLIEHYAYDPRNKVVALDRRLRESSVRLDAAQVLPKATGVLSFTYEYNDAGMVTVMTYPDGAGHDFRYDGVHGRLEGIDEGKETITPFVTSMAYNKAAQVTRMAWGNGTREEWSFDNRKRISRLTVSSPAGKLEDLSYTLSAAGNVVEINDNAYTYDGFNRLATAKTKLPETEDRSKRVARSFGTYLDGGPVSGTYYDSGADLNSDGRVNGEDDLIASYDGESGQYDDEAFTYDGNGNRTLLVQNGDEYSYEYGPRNQLAKIYLKKKGESVKKLYAEYTYDANGNTVSRDLYGTGTTATRTDFAYDTLNRLTSTTTAGKVTSYAYDNAGNRLYKKNADGMTLYLRHGQIAVAMDVETYSSTSGEGKTKVGAVNRYVLSGDLLAGRVTATTLRTGTTSVTKSYYHLDHQNSTKVVTNEAGSVEVSYVYRAFGEQLRKLGTGDATYTYGGKELDEITNLYYFNARYYDATIGRFINMDPVQDGANWYVYCKNNPMNAVDPTGLGDIVKDVDDKTKNKFIKFMTGGAGGGGSNLLGFRGLDDGTGDGLDSFKSQGKFDSLAKRSRLPNEKPFGSIASDGERTSFSSRQAGMLADDVGYNVSPEGWFSKFDTLGKSGTFITDKKAIVDVLGDFKVGVQKTSTQQTSGLEKALGLEPNSLSKGFRITEITGISGLSPRSPLAGNSFFLGPGVGLPGGGPEMIVNPIPTRH